MRKIQKHALILTGVFIAWYAAHASIIPPRSTGKIIEDFQEIPLQISDWSGETHPGDQITAGLLPLCSALNRTYENDEGYDTSLVILYGADLGDFHQPEACMEGQGWKRMTSRMVKLSSESPHPVVITKMTNDTQTILMMYWFASKDASTVALGKHKVFAFWDRLQNNELQPTAMVRFITPIETDVASAERITLDLASKLDPHIKKILAKTPRFEKTSSGLYEE